MSNFDASSFGQDKKSMQEGFEALFGSRINLRSENGQAMVRAAMKILEKRGHAKGDIMEILEEAMPELNPTGELMFDEQAAADILPQLEGKEPLEALAILQSYYAGKGKDVVRPILGQRPIRNKGPLVGRNDPCPCGSGNKFKKCCAKNESKKQ